jgi:hypothetical protein
MRRANILALTAAFLVITTAAAWYLILKPDRRVEYIPPAPYDFQAEEVRRLGNDLVPIGRVEVYAIDREESLRGDRGSRDAQILGYKIVAGRSVEGDDARQIASLWRGFRFGGMGYGCHEPPYGLRFIGNAGDMIFETTVCWACCNVSLPRSGYCGFGRGTTNPEDLLDLLDDLVPYLRQ